VIITSALCPIRSPFSSPHPKGGKAARNKKKKKKQKEKKNYFFAAVGDAYF